MLSNKKVLLPIISTLGILVIALSIVLIRQAVIKNKIDNGYKQISVEVISTIEGKEYSKTYKFWTKEGILGKALDEAKFNMQFDTYGNFRMIHTIDGIKVDSSKEEWWKIYYNNEESMSGIDDLLIKHEDEIKFELTVGFDIE